MSRTAIDTYPKSAIPTTTAVPDVPISSDDMTVVSLRADDVTVTHVASDDGDDDSDSLYNERPSVAPQPPAVTVSDPYVSPRGAVSTVRSTDADLIHIDTLLDAEDEDALDNHTAPRSPTTIASFDDSKSPPMSRPPRVAPAASNGLVDDGGDDDDDDDSRHLHFGRVETLEDNADPAFEQNHAAVAELVHPMVEVALTPTPQTHRVHARDSLIVSPIDDDDRFDSDEHVDVESLSSSDDEPNESQSSYTVPPSVSSVLPANFAAPDSIPTQSMPALPTPKRPQSSGISLLSRASQTFYKTFMGRKTSSDKRTPSLVAASSSSTTDTVSTHVTGGDDNNSVLSAAMNATTITDDRYERLCHLLDAQLSALAGAKTGFVQLALLRPLAEETLRAVTVDARGLLGEFGQLEAHAERRRREAEDATAKGEHEVVQKERMLIEAKVALAEACGDVERLRGELAAVKRTLADPATRSRRLRKNVDVVKRETAACRDARSAVEGKLAERRRSLGREKAELSRLEKEFRDIEGDWA